MRKAGRQWYPLCSSWNEGRSTYPSTANRKKDPRRLRRLRNIRDNPIVSFLVDRYDEDWSKLAFLHIRGKASILTEKGVTAAERDELERCARHFRKKYAQYETVSLGEPERVMIRITPQSSTFWENP